MREIRLCARLNHQNIVPFVGIAWSTLVDLAVLSDLMPRGDVHELLQSERRFERVQNRRFHWRRAASSKQAADEMTTKTSVALDVGRAVSYLHDLSIIHRDLKAKNVLLSASFEAKLSDFGISRVTKLDETMTANVGTIAWIAPEVLTTTTVLTGHRYTTKADIYSFGAFLSEMDTLGTPYATETSTNCEGFSNARIAILVGIHCMGFFLVSQGQLQPSFTHNMPPTLLALARQCLEFHGSERPSAAQVVAALEAFLHNPQD
ncbi:hypothetical protein DYB34_009363 [Aphanomyces astaci]|uniref:Protein kinase domain-containing protein n=1 Tax=Aphanomyces astaci TaxID=112090 RepID=A0A3R6VJW3_APHAT|nr:hypothetical protein DYB34_009363 [Aphanomyces astaci]